MAFAPIRVHSRFNCLSSVLDSLSRFAICVAIAFAARALPAEDSGGYRGPQNNGIYPAHGLLKAWPENGPPLAWKCWIDQAYANCMVRDDTVYIAAQILGGGSKNYVHVISPDGKVQKCIQAGDAPWKRYGGTRSSAIVSGNMCQSTAMASCSGTAAC